MRLKLIRQLPAADDKVELLFEVDEELMEVYRSETGENEFEQESFDEWVNDLLKYSIEGENWRYENED
tara:strand:+ start:23819 stop:24022 length:204 start_codon:yes stop_codon:yes gene_type:complete